MGSFQQISLGVVCLVAAFLFGNYVNNHPNPEKVTHAFSGVDSQASTESNSSILEPGKTFQSSPIGMLQNKTVSQTPTMKMPNLFDSADSVAANRPQIEQANNRLPPPSQLDPTNSVSQNQQSSGQPSAVRMPNLLDTPKRREIVVPDFSQLANEFRNTPLELPPMGIQNYPNQNSKRPNIKLPPRNGNGRTAVVNRPPGNLANNPTQSKSGQAAPTQVMQAQTIVKAQSIPSNFTADDFAPKLKSGNDSAQPNSNRANHQIVSINPIGPTNSTVEPVFLDAAPPQFDSKKSANPSTPNDRSQQYTNRDDDHSNHDHAAHAHADHNHADHEQGSRSVMVSESNNSVIPKTNPFHQSVDASRSELPIEKQQDWTQQGSTNRVAMNRESNMKPVTPPTVIVQRADVQPLGQTHQSGRAMIPFGLTDEAKTQLVRMRRPAETEIELGTTRFADYVSRNGDTLQSLSQKYYGRPDFYLDIYLANKHILRNPTHIPVGVNLRIPLYQ